MKSESRYPHLSRAASWILSPLLVTSFSVNLNAQLSTSIRINEFLASNVSVNADIVDYDDFSDWIELYNEGDVDEDLGGFSLTDDPDNPRKWIFPAGTILPARTCLLIWADGYDDVPGSVRERPYPPNDPFVTTYFHTNFKLERGGEFIGLFGPDTTLIDSVRFGLQQHDVSMGRQPDGSGPWAFYGEPTPALPNTTEGILTIAYAGSPQVSLASGFYAGSQSVSVSPSVGGAEVRYTLDGSRPTTGSTLVTGPVSVASTQVLRVRQFESAKIPGPVVTRTYFIDDQSSLSVVSIAAPSQLLFDNTKGIYLNALKGRELPVHIELFEPDGRSGFKLNAGLTLTGQQSLFYPQKSFTLTADDRFGVDIIDYPVFPTRNQNAYTSLYLRNAGVPDNRSTFMRDALVHSLVMDRMDLDVQAYRPAAVFLNGGYWGVYNLRDKINSSYLAALHNVNPDDIDLLEYESVITPTVMEGEGTDYTAFYEFVRTHDLSQSDAYAMVDAWMDIDSYINYMITEIYCDNTAWFELNVRMWRERKQGAKWRWILFDTDFGFGMPNQFSTGYTNNTLRMATSSNYPDPYVPALWSTLIFRKLLQNNAFRTEFIRRFASYLNTAFHPDTVLGTIDKIQSGISPEMARHIARWRDGDFYYGYPIASYSEWLSNVNVVRSFARFRPPNQRQHIIDYFGLGGTAVLSVIVRDSGAGSVVVNEIEKIDATHDGIHFRNVPTVLRAKPSIGYRFVRWEGADTLSANPIEVVPNQDTVSVAAVFEAISVATIPAHIDHDTTLSAASSPYYASSTVTVDSGVTLTIEAGVQVLMSPGASVVVHGRVLTEGTEGEPVVFAPYDPSAGWGAICFVEATDSSILSHTRIAGSTRGPDYARDPAAISGFRSRFGLDHVTVDGVQAPVFARYGSVRISNCSLTTDVAGDLINLKQADVVLVENCDLRGNDEFDSDGIDLDGVLHGIVRGNRIYNMYGFNSDAIDLGEGAKDVLVEGNIIYNISDKGVSVGQGSETLIRRNIIANCGQGVGVKDFDSFARIEHTTFYGNHLAVASFEKILGHGGGNAEVVNSILANSVVSPFLVDQLSRLSITYSLSNTIGLPGFMNIEAEPRFLNDLTLSVGSPAIDAGNPALGTDPDGSSPDLGALPYDAQAVNTLVIDEIHYNPQQGESYEFVELVNIGHATLDLTGMSLTGAVSYTFGAGAIAAGERIVVARTSAPYEGQGYKVFQWSSGALPDGAGTVSVVSPSGALIDRVDYDNRGFWPTRPNGQGVSLELHNTTLENMISSSWRSSYEAGGTPGRSGSAATITGLYINEFMADNDAVIADDEGEYDDWIELYNSNDVEVDISGLYVTDDLTLPNKYQIPLRDRTQTTIPAKGFILLWADGQTGQGIRHLSFALSRTGEQMGLAQALDSGIVFLDTLSFGAQETNRSFGRYPDGAATWQVLDVPTPGGSNLPTDVEEEKELPTTFALYQNYPNPFNPSTTIRFQIPEAAHVRLAIFDVLGRQIVVLVDEEKPAGAYTATWNAVNMSSGVYIYRLLCEGFIQTRKMVIVR